MRSKFNRTLKDIETKLRIRKFDDLLVLLAVFFFIFGCIIIPEPPIPVELTTFADLSNTTTLQFDAGGEQESFELNISRYITVGNSSELNKGAGVVEEFRMQICPTEHLGSNVSNLVLHWPTGNSVLFYPGVLTSCENVSIDPEDFNYYLQVHQSPSVANFASNILGGGGFYTEWGISMKNPKMKDVDDPVTYQLMILEPVVPANLMSQLIALTGETLPPGFDLIEGARLSGLQYTCYEWDGVRETTTPSASYPIMLSVPGLNLSSLIPGLTIPNGTIIMNATVFDMDCPPYGTPGKYRADVRKMQLQLDNYTGSVPSDSFADDFDSPLINPAWYFRGASVNWLGYYEEDIPSSTINLYSEANISGSSMYYYRNYTVDESGGSLLLEANISTAGLPGLDLAAIPDGAGVVGFMVNSSYPAGMAPIMGQMRGMLAFGNNLTLVACPDSSMIAFVPSSADFHSFKINITNDTATYYLDGAQIAQCANSTSDDLYVMVSSDFATDAFLGNISMDWINVTAYSGGPGTWAEDWSEFDHFDSALNTTAWLMRNVSSYGGLATYNYEPALSRIQLISQPATPGDPSTANLLYYNSSITAPTTNESGTYIVANVFFNESTPDAAVGLYFTNETIEPTTFGESLTYFRGGLGYYQEYMFVLCPNMSESVAFNLSQVSELLGWPPVTGWHELAYYSTNETTVFLYDAMPISIGCSAQNESTYVALTSDPYTNLASGNTSVGWFEVYDVDYMENYTGSAWFDLGLLAYAEFLNQTIYSDVIVFDADAEGDKYGRVFEFEIESDSPGIVEVSNVNLTYGSLISYGDAGTYPTSTLDDDSDFSWFMINSHLVNSEMALNSYAYNSTITDSEIIMSRVDCTNITNSRLVFSGAVYNPRSPDELGILSTLIGDLNITDCSGEIVNSDLEFVFLLGGNAWNSNISTLPAMIATDFRDAEFSNLTLRSGQMIVNGTRAPDLFDGPVELSELFGAAIEGLTNQSNLPFGCEEDSEMVMDSTADLRLCNSTAAVMNCRFNLYNSNFTIRNSTFENEFGGIRVSLHNSSLRVGNLTELVNITTYGQFTDVVFWNVNTSLLPGELILSSEDVYVETGMASLNKNSTKINFTELTTIVNTSLIFNYVGTWDGHITYYENYTSNMSEALKKGIECPQERCYKVVHDTVAHTLRVDVSNFSTYVVNYTPTPPGPTPPTLPPGGNGGTAEFTLNVEGECVGEAVLFTASHSGLDMEGVKIQITNQASGTTSVHTDVHGNVEFFPQNEGTYYYVASEDGYEDKTGSFLAVICEEEPILLPDVPIVEETPLENPEGHEGECGIYEGGIWTPYSCCTDSDCGVGEQCVVNTCVPAAVSVIEIDETGHTEIEIPSEEGPAEAPQKEVPSLSCCLFGICMDFAGICWYYWLIAIVLLVLAAGTYFHYVPKRKPSKKK